MIHVELQVRQIYTRGGTPVSIFGVESKDFITDTHTMSNQAGGCPLGNGNYISYAKTNYSDDASVGFWQGVDSGVAKLNIGSATQNMKWDGVNLSITGAIVAASGSIGGWTVDSDSIDSPDGLITLDSANDRIRVKNSAGTNYVTIDGSGITAHDSVLGTTFTLPTDGSAPTFSAGVINEVTYKMYTSGIIKTSDNPASTGGAVIDSSGISLYNSSGVRTAFLDAVNSQHEFSGSISIYDWTDDIKPNLLKNPTAALGNDFWSGPASAAIGSAGEGSCWYLTNTGAPATLVHDSDLIPFSAGLDITISADMYTGGLTAGAFCCDTVYCNSSQVVIGEGPQITIPYTSAGGWQRYSASGTTPANTAYVMVRFFLQAATSTSTAIKRIKLESSASATPFTGGDRGAAA